jgi:hypothetical protein
MASPTALLHGPDYTLSHHSPTVLLGSLDANHTSTINAFYLGLPTPWPFLLASVLLSIVLGFLGLHSSSRSWHPTHGRGRHWLGLRWFNKDNDSQNRSLVDSSREPGSNVYTSVSVSDAHDTVQMQPAEKNSAAANELLAEYAREGIEFNRSDDYKPDGGTGMFCMIRTIIGAFWTSIRSFAVLGACIRVAQGNNKKGYPAPTNIIILMMSVQTYLGGRGMPRFINLLLALDVVVCYIAFLIAMFGPFNAEHYYGKIGVTGGSCPYFDKNYCEPDFWPTVGCTTNSTWNATVMGYPHGSARTHDPDPNRATGAHANVLVSVERIVGTISAVYGAVTLFSIVPMFFIVSKASDLLRPLDTIKMARTGKWIHMMGKIAFGIMVVLALITVPAHIAVELNPPSFKYIDTFGPPINITVFTNFSYPGSVAFQQSHKPPYTDFEAPFLGGNSTSWSDCFTVQPPKDKLGHLRDWWGMQQDQVLTALSGV